MRKKLKNLDHSSSQKQESGGLTVAQAPPGRNKDAVLALKSLKSVLSNTVAPGPSDRNSAVSHKTFVAIEGMGTPERILQKTSNDEVAATYGQASG